MRGPVQTIARGALLTVLIVGAAGPARADHVADLIGPDRSTCRLGALASGIGIDLTTTDVKTKVEDGLTVHYRCRFTNIPDHVSAEDSEFGEEWFLPSKRLEGTTACWRPEFEGREEGSGHYVITPKGALVLTCDFKSPEA